MNQAEIIRSFDEIYLGDSLLQHIELKTGEAECCLTFDLGRILQLPEADIFAPKLSFEPACLKLRAVRSISCSGTYQLNSTVVGFGARPGKVPEYTEFHFDLTGGSDPDAFMVTVTIVAKEFQFGPSPLPDSPGQ